MVVGDLQRSGMKRSRIESPAATHSPRFSGRLFLLFSQASLYNKECPAFPLLKFMHTYLCCPLSIPQKKINFRVKVTLNPCFLGFAWIFVVKDVLKNVISWASPTVVSHVAVTSIAHPRTKRRHRATNHWDVGSEPHWLMGNNPT